MKSFNEWKVGRHHDPFDPEKDDQEQSDRIKWLVNGIVKKELIPQIDSMIDRFLTTPQSSPLGMLDNEGEHRAEKDEVYAALIEGMKIRLENFKFYHR